MDAELIKYHPWSEFIVLGCAFLFFSVCSLRDRVRSVSRSKEGRKEQAVLTEEPERV